MIITHGYINEGLAPATRRPYSAGQQLQSFSTFCNASRSRVLPITESALLLFISHLASKNTSRATIKFYLAAVHHMHVIAGMHNPFEEQLTPGLQLALRGIKRTQAIVIPCRILLPITLHIMCAIKDYLSKQPHSPCFGPHAAWLFSDSSMSVSSQFPAMVPMIQEPTFH